MKKFFEKVKMDVKFHKAGEGHTLSESSRSQLPPSEPPATRLPPSSESQRAGVAAIERLSKQEPKGQRPHSSSATWKHTTQSREADLGNPSAQHTTIDFNEMRRQVREEMHVHGSEMRSQEAACSHEVERKEIEVQSAPVLAVSGVFFNCPLCPVCLPKLEIDEHMEECLKKDLQQQPEMTVCTMIHSLNKDKGKVKNGIEILCRYLDNICKNPEEEKFRNIKQSNRIFQEKVAGLKGVPEFLQVCGFVNTTKVVEGSDEYFFVLNDSSTEVIEKLHLMKDILQSTEPVKPRLDRSLRVLQPSTNVGQFELPDDFFSITAGEVKKEQLLREEEIEKSRQLRTRAMRENDKNPSKTYKYTLIRVRFPEGVILQATFSAQEPVKALFELVRESLVSEWQPFLLTETGSKQLPEEEVTFQQLSLVPAAVVNFSWEPTILAEIASSGADVQNNACLKPEVMLRLEK